MDEILKIFVNNSNLMQGYLKPVIEAHGDELNLICEHKNKNEKDKNIQPYHKYLECLLQDYST